MQEPTIGEGDEVHTYESFKNLTAPLEVNHGPCIKQVPQYLSSLREVTLKGGPGGISSSVSHMEILMPPLYMGIVMAASCLLCHVDSAPSRPTLCHVGTAHLGTTFSGRHCQQASSLDSQ